MLTQHVQQIKRHVLHKASFLFQFESNGLILCEERDENLFWFQYGMGFDLEMTIHGKVVLGKAFRRRVVRGCLVVRDCWMVH